MAAVALRTVVGLRVSAVLQRHVHLSRRAQARHIPGKKGPTAPPTAAVVLALLTPVTLVHCTLENAPLLQVHGLQEDPLSICEALGMDYGWYQGVTAEQHSPPWTTPP